MVKNINELTLAYAKDVENPILNFEMGLSFYRRGHYPSALNFFLRASELSDDDHLIYKSLIMCSECLHFLGNRQHSLRGFLLHAISILPERPEAWFLYIRLYKENGEWQECFSHSVNCLRTCNFEFDIIEGLGYLGYQDFLLFKMISGYHAGRFEESKKAVIAIAESYWDPLSEEQSQLVYSYIKLHRMAPSWLEKII
jgi:tetratricopeptide (TPR) repeat protein